MFVDRVDRGRMSIKVRCSAVCFLPPQSHGCIVSTQWGFLFGSFLQRGHDFVCFI